MKSIDTEYLRIVDKILTNGEFKDNRTGVRTIAIPGEMIQWNMQDGFPLLTTKKVPYKSIKVELEGFIKGINSKKWFQDRGCSIWNEWCNPQKVPYSKDEKTKELMKQEDNLGKFYGVQWRNFNSQGIDQFKNIINTLKINPNDRRMVVSAWNPAELGEMALVPCHYAFQVTVINGKLNLFWNQRSVDTALGLPFNIASYATLLHLLAKESNLQEGTLTGFLADVHIYEPHIENLKVQLSRQPLEMPIIETKEFKSIFDWQYTDTQLLNYQSHEKLSFEVAV